MNQSLLVVFLFLTLSTGRSDGVINHRFFRGIDGGFTCATCTVLVSMADQLAEVNNQTIIETIDAFCLKLPKMWQKPCQLICEIVGPLIIDMVAEGANADDICRGLGKCYTDKGQKTCALYQKTVKFKESKIFYYQQKTKKHLLANWGISEGWSICEIPGIRYLCDSFDHVFNKHMPESDRDGDLHSSRESLRGASWRGKDCDDTRKDVYPGRKPELLSDSLFDSNCNGIWGVDNTSNLHVPYETKFCSGSGQMGVVAIGDSVGAHFHAPEEWFSPPLLTKDSLKDFAFILENELDWPQLSVITGYMDSIWSVAKGPTDSIYKRLVERNRCNHRDYQNIAVNGDESFEVLSVVKTLRRNPKVDYPLLAFVELVGNDVCNHHKDTIANMTTPEQMESNLLKLFDALNSTAPFGSKVLIIGMADGNFLYQFLHNRTHPFGRLRNDLTYSDVYEWWNCLEVTPCRGWLNNNATLRKLTTERAVQLSLVMKNVAVTYKHNWKNLELNYIDCPITTVIKEWLFDHGPLSGWQLIEPVDGFHPNQLGQAKAAANVWEYMELNLPHYLGPLNPHNDQINKTFKNQGGY